MIVSEKTEEQLLEQIQRIEPFVGNTPLFPINNAFQKPGIKIYAKLEWQQLGGSVKARPAFNIMKNAIINGQLNKERHLLDASSGNTAIAYAAIGAALGIPVTICLPENASEERKILLRAHGAHIVYTSKFGSTDEAQEKALELFNENPDKYFYADQYGNENNWQAHYNTTAFEIFKQTESRISHFVTGLGTTGSFVGNSRRLKELNPDIQLISLEPDSALHGLEGWKHLETAKVPRIYDATIANENLEIDTSEAYFWVKKVAQTEGILISPSAGANLAGAIKVAQELDEGVIVTLFPDNADKYGEVLNQLF
ncbi:cysteine synthase family protein [Fulvivirgaceae bacterium BMA10]|uniref:Cysteine synthase family protein n=1 Tax=Splendidivirga corallicola TaxID=3051826 RepID=A0ABT8KW37_9BACT|nr:cysteine synthase family protein [Fulvivirgaceae bacterium BMA10]